MFYNINVGNVDALLPVRFPSGPCKRSGIFSVYHNRIHHLRILFGHPSEMD